MHYDDLYNLTVKGYDTFLNAAKMRQDNVYERLSCCIHDKDSFIAKGPKCHRSCRSRYTHKRDLEVTANPLKRSKQEETTMKPQEKQDRVKTDKKHAALYVKNPEIKRVKETLFLLQQNNAKSPYTAKH